MTIMNTEQLLAFEAAENDYQDQIILITGAGDGIGKALALACSKSGATVVLIGEETKKLEAVYDAIEAQGGPQPAIYPMNFAGTNANDFQVLATTIEEQLGGIDAVVSNAGWIGGFRPFQQIQVDEYMKIMNINLHTPFWLAHSCIPLLKKSSNGALLFSSHHTNRAYYGAFGVAKNGVDGLIDILAHEFSGENGIRVNGIDSGPINTQMRRTHFPGEDWDKLPEPESILPAYLHLLSLSSKDISGENFRL